MLAAYCGRPKSTCLDLGTHARMAPAHNIVTLPDSKQNHVTARKQPTLLLL